jgi:hypothetical protein
MLVEPGNVKRCKACRQEAEKLRGKIRGKGGVAALVGNTYGAAKDVGVYVTGEAIRGGLLILKRRSASDARTSHRRRSLPVLLSAPYGSRSDKAS